jgi:hypothetical protein
MNALIRGRDTVLGTRMSRPGEAQRGRSRTHTRPQRASELPEITTGRPYRCAVATAATQPV